MKDKEYEKSLPAFLIIFYIFYVINYIKFKLQYILN